MDKYKKLLYEIFEYTVRDSTSISQKDVSHDGFSISEITIKFNHINVGENDQTYEKLKMLIDNIVKELRKWNRDDDIRNHKIIE